MESEAASFELNYILQHFRHLHQFCTLLLHKLPAINYKTNLFKYVKIEEKVTRITLMSHKSLWIGISMQGLYSSIFTSKYLLPWEINHAYFITTTV